MEGLRADLEQFSRELVAETTENFQEIIRRAIKWRRIENIGIAMVVSALICIPISVLLIQNQAANNKTNIATLCTAIRNLNSTTQKFVLTDSDLRANQTRLGLSYQLINLSSASPKKKAQVRALADRSNRLSFKAASFWKYTLAPTLNQLAYGACANSSQ